jgi:hypothetical protein
MGSFGGLLSGLGEVWGWGGETIEDEFWSDGLGGRFQHLHFLLLYSQMSACKVFLVLL